MSSIAVDIAESVKEALNAHAFSQPFESERIYIAKLDLEALSALKVGVSTREHSIARANRTELNFDTTIVVSVRKRAPKGEPLGLDELVALTQEIALFLENLKVLDDAPTSTRLGPVAIAPIYDPNHLNDWNQFTSYVLMPFRTKQAVVS